MNFHKHFVGASGVVDVTLEGFATMLNCTITKLPFVYLGISISANPRKEKMWKPIMDKFAIRLNS